MYQKILGGLIGAAAGDAMGAATETRTRKQIEEKFGGYVTDFLAPPDDTFARGSKAGQVTDDFSVAYMTLKEVVAQIFRHILIILQDPRPKRAFAR